MKYRSSYHRVAKNKFLQLAEVEYDDEGVTRKWELAQRTTRSAASDAAYSPVKKEGSETSDPIPFFVDAVDILAMLIDPREPAKGGPRRMVLISQYRPPLDAYCLEFPAGLLDPNETPIQAAVRELHEETGYVVDPSECKVSPTLAYEPGMSDSCFHLVSVAIDLSRPENQNPCPSFDEGEDITLHIVTHNETMLEQFDAICKSFEKEGKRMIIDSKVYTYGMGLRMALGV